MEEGSNKGNEGVESSVRFNLGGIRKGEGKPKREGSLEINGNVSVEELNED